MGKKMEVTMIGAVSSFATFVFALHLDAAAAQTPQQLQLDVPVERTIAPKESHDYIVNVRPNEAFHVVVEQLGVDVVLTILDPRGERLAESDSAFEEQGTGGSEVAHVRALSPGDYKVKVVTFERQDAKPGKYVITLKDRRDLTADEVANAESEREIAPIEQRWEEAVERTDIPTLSTILRSDAFRLGPYAGSAGTREQMLADFEQGAKQREKLGLTQKHTISEHVLRAAGNLAVSTGRFLITNTHKELGESTFSGQFVHVWAKNDQGWKLVNDFTVPFGRAPRKEKPSPSTVPPSVLAAYAGTYRPENGFATLTLTVESGALMAQWKDLMDTSPKVALTPLTDTTFAGFFPNEEITFVRDSTGRVREIIFIGDGPAARARRVD